MRITHYGVGHRFGQHYNGLKNGTDCPAHYPLNSKIRCRDDCRNDGQRHIFEWVSLYENVLFYQQHIRTLKEEY